MNETLINKNSWNDNIKTYENTRHRIAEIQEAFISWYKYSLSSQRQL